MRQLSILITLLVMSSLALSGKVFPGLKVKGNYKNLHIVVENVYENAANLNTEQVERAVKLRLLRNGIKTLDSTYDPHYLYINIDISKKGTYYCFDLELRKNAFGYGIDKSITGISFKPNQGTYGGLGLAGQSSSHVIGHVERILDAFILDYLESNME